MQFVILVTLLNFSLILSHGFNGINLKLAAIHAPPFDVLTLGPTGNYSVTGSSVRGIRWLAEKLNFTFTVIPVEEALISKLGTNEAAFSKVVNKEVDAILSGFAVTLDRKERMDFTHPIWIEPYTLIVPKPQEESRLFAFVQPFQPTVWICFLVSLIVIVIFMSGFSLIYIENNLTTTNGTIKAKKTPKNFNRGNIEKIVNQLSFFGIFVINVVTNHGIYTPYGRLSFRVLVGCWLLAAVVLVNSYSGIVASSLTVPKMKPAVNSLENLAGSKDVAIIIRQDFALGQQILSATSGLFKALGDQVRQHPGRILSSSGEIIKQLETGHYAYPYLRIFNHYFLAEQFKKDGKCRFQSSSPLPISGSFCMVLQKDSKYTSEINAEVIKLGETGLLPFWIKQLVSSKADRCLVNNHKTSLLGVAIKLEDLSSAFFILGIGTGLALLSFILEIVFRLKHNAKNSFTPFRSTPVVPHQSITIKVGH